MKNNSDSLRKTWAEYSKRYRKENKLPKVKFSAAEFKIIEDKARMSGITPTEFIRQASLGKRIKAVDLNANYRVEYKIEIRRIGHNINQIAKALNNRFLPCDVKRLHEEIEEFRLQLEQLYKTFK